MRTPPKACPQAQKAGVPYSRWTRPSRGGPALASPVTGPNRPSHAGTSASTRTSRTSPRSDGGQHPTSRAPLASATLRATAQGSPEVSPRAASAAAKAARSAAVRAR